MLAVYARSEIRKPDVLQPDDFPKIRKPDVRFSDIYCIPLSQECKLDICGIKKLM